jgi:hypothetical protein
MIILQLSWREHAKTSQEVPSLVGLEIEILAQKKIAGKKRFTDRRS